MWQQEAIWRSLIVVKCEKNQITFLPEYCRSNYSVTIHTYNKIIMIKTNPKFKMLILCRCLKTKWHCIPLLWVDSCFNLQNIKRKFCLFASDLRLPWDSDKTSKMSSLDPDSQHNKILLKLCREGNLKCILGFNWACNYCTEYRTRGNLWMKFRDKARISI